MEIEKKRIFIIQTIYYTIYILLIYGFFHIIFPVILPFCIGFLIAFLLRTPIQFLTTFTKGYRRIWELCTLLLLYTILLFIFIPLLTKLGILCKHMLEQLPFLYEQNILPYLQQPYDAFLTPPSFLQQLPISVWNSMLQAISEMISSILSSFLYLLKTWFTQLPNIIFSCFLTIISSIIFQFYYTNMTQTLLHVLPAPKQSLLRACAQYTKQTFYNMLKINIALISVTWLQLCIGFWILGIHQPYYCATLIACFDALPMIGISCIFLPWIIIHIASSQLSTAIYLCILYMCILLTRNILEPKLMGKQLGLHPVLALFSLYLGGKLFGILGMMIFPHILMLLHHLHKDGYLFQK